MECQKHIYYHRSKRTILKICLMYRIPTNYHGLLVKSIKQSNRIPKLYDTYNIIN